MPSPCKARASFSQLFWSFACGGLFAICVAAGVTLWITNAPIPFVAKIQSTNVKSLSEVLDGKNLDPNAKLYAEGQGVDQTTGSSVIPVTAEVKPAEGAALPTIDTDRIWVQAGAFSQSDDAEAMRARIAFMGLDAQVSYKNENGQRLYRVRIGPFESNAQAEEIIQSLADNAIQGAIVRLKN
jgi:cell division protein FtsN